MKEFLSREFGTTNIQDVDKEALKQRIEGDALIERISYRKQVANQLAMRKQVVIAKG